MNPTLCEEDRRVVDLLLDRSSSAGANGGGNGTHLFAEVRAAGPERLNKVQRVLSLLNAMPNEEPASDLVDRTMRRVEDAAGNHPGALRPPQPVIDSRPHA